MSVLQVQEAVKIYGKVRAVDGVSFSLDQGDNLAIVGESGCGKTTLAKMIMGLVMPDEGLIKAEPQSLQMVFQDPQQSLDPLWNVQSILKEALWRKKKVTDTFLEQMLTAVGLPADALGRFPHEFSGGERQRIAIARALLASPKVLVLDEAVSSLDTLVQKQIMDLLRKLKGEFNLTYIFISHNLRLVRNFSDKMMVMHQGKVIEQGGTSQILHSPSHPYTQQLLQAAFYKTL
jgi:ABC-type dipeptide/oligopeptide/nickel transport system ATPase subunit